MRQLRTAGIDRHDRALVDGIDRCALVDVRLDSGGAPRHQVYCGSIAGGRDIKSRRNFGHFYVRRNPGRTDKFSAA